MIELITSLLIGLGIGILTGLVPGLHPNTLIPIITPLVLMMNPLSFAGLVISTSISSNFFEFIKTIYFGVPDEGSVLASQPAHELLLNGRGLEAIKLLSIGALIAILMTSLLITPLIFVIPIIYGYVKPYVPMLLVLISLHFILRERERIGWAVIVFFASGIIGLVVLNNNLMNEPLLAMLCGFFGASTLIDNVGKGVEVPSQLQKIVTEVDKKTVISGGLKAVLAASIITFIPAVGPAQASLIANEASKMKNKKEYLITIGGVNTADVIYSVIALITINKARSGMVELIKEYLKLSMTEYFILILCIIGVGVVSYFLVQKFAKLINKGISKINYGKLSLIILIFLTALVTVINGFFGLITFIACTLIGRLANKKNLNKSHLLACMVLPTLSYYF